MAPGRLALSALLALGVAASAACYRPNITDGGLACADGGVCPDGFECSLVDNHCYKSDAGPSCPANKPHVTPLCADPPANGSACNPACQIGCACGRCTVVGTSAECATVGAKNEGEVCNVASDDCGIGLSCVKETCGTALGRCRKFCRMDQDCPTGVYCTMPSGPATVCGDVPAQSCDPVTGAGCPSGLFCYVRGSNQTTCECPGTVAAGSQCGGDTDCSPGNRCVTVGMGGKPLCFPVCSISGANTCPAGTGCMPIGSTYGVCQ
jgi:hypothetical protein